MHVVLSESRLQYLDELLGFTNYLQLGSEEWLTLCCEVVCNCSVFARMDSMAVVQAWIHHKAKH